MTTPRSPVTTRKLGDTSFEAQGEDGAAKAQKMDSETPSWAQALLRTMNNVEASQARTKAKLDAMQIRVEKLEVKVDQERMEEGIAFFHKNFFSLFVSMLAGLLSLMYVETIGI